MGPGIVDAVTGMSPRFIPMFWKIWKPNQDATPTARSRPNGSSHRSATTSPRTTRKPSSRIRPPAPRRPSSSPATEKMKSVYWNGMNPPCVCGPSPSPVPDQPPDPIASRACRVW